jgi:hypothetical protein
LLRARGKQGGGRFPARHALTDQDNQIKTTR